MVLPKRDHYSQFLILHFYHRVTFLSKTIESLFPSNEGVNKDLFKTLHFVHHFVDKI